MSLFLYLDTPISPKWARRVKKHQRDLMTRLHATPGAPPDDCDPPLPWTIEDLIRPSKNHSRCCTSKYRGVLKALVRDGWVAYRPETSRAGRKQIGHDYPSERAAADAVLHTLNPDAPPTPPEEMTCSK